MATRTVVETFKMSPLDVTKNDRTGLRADMEKYWLGRENSNIGLQYFRFKDGRVSTPFSFERRDLMCIQSLGACNVFVHPDGDYDVQCWEGVTLDAKELLEIKQFVKKTVKAEKEFIERNRRFLESQPWKQCDGMTVADAIAKMKELGW